MLLQALVQLGDRWGYVDKNGTMVIKAQFSDAEDFSEGLAAARVGVKWGYIDRTGKIVIAPQFDDAAGFTDGLGRIAMGGKVGRLSFMESGEKRGRVGYVDRAGKYVWEPSQ